MKWFDPNKGFGFVVCDHGGPDILLHLNVLRAFGPSSVAAGARVEMMVQSTPRGVQAVAVVSLDPPESEDSGDAVPFEAVADAAAGPLLPARVKWFDTEKGFGFANVFGRSEDIFLHVEVLRRFGLSALMPGEAVAVRVADGRRGKLAIEIRAWQSVPSSDP